MSARRTKTLLPLCLILAGAVAGWDVLLLYDEEQGNTISSVLNDQAWAGAGLGFAIGHLFNNNRWNLPLWASLSAGAATIGAGFFIENALVATLAGLVAGIAFWPNSGKQGA